MPFLCIGRTTLDLRPLWYLEVAIDLLTNLAIIEDILPDSILMSIVRMLSDPADLLLFNLEIILEMSAAQAFLNRHEIFKEFL